MKQKFKIYLFLFCGIAVFASGQNLIVNGFDTISWNEYFSEKTVSGDITPGNLIIFL